MAEHTETADSKHAKKTDPHDAAARKKEHAAEELEATELKSAAAHKSAEAQERIAEDLGADELNMAKVHLYELFIRGKIKRGVLDRELDRLYAKRQDASSAKKEPTQTPRQPDATKIVTRYAWWSAGSGLIPVAAVDFVAVTTIQVLLLKDLCELYGTPFREQWGKELVSVLIGTYTPGFLKSIPGLGTLVGTITAPVVNAGATYALGRVFIQHFESGGTLLSFDPAKMKSYFADYYEAAPALRPQHA